MSDMEGHGEESGGRHELAGEAMERARRLRAQAELAWDRVQRVVQRGAGPAISTEDLLQAARRVPDEGYLAGTGLSLLFSAWLYGAGRRAAGLSLGALAALALGFGVYAKGRGVSRR